jgi:GTP-binding protein
MVKDIKFFKSVYDLKDLPGKSLPEIILCGRSNVGKSTFINTLFNKKSLAKTSSSPGKTRSINFYLVNDKFYIVDLPGYGYAKASKEEKKKWGKFLSEYIVQRNNILHAFHILDSRHTPSELDLKMNALLKISAIPYTFILNKVDKLKQSEYAKVYKTIVNTFPEAVPDKNVLLFSSFSGKYKLRVLKKLESLFSHLQV